MKHFLESLERDIDFQFEYEKLERMVVSEYPYHNNSINTLLISNFRDWKKRGNYTSFNEVRERLGFKIDYNSSNYQTAYDVNMEKFFLYSEMILNLLILLDDYKDDRLRRQIDAIYETMEFDIEKSGFEIKAIDKELIIVEKNAAAIEAADIVPDLADTIIEYNHYLLKGKVDEKKALLKKIVDALEPRRKELETICNQETSDFFYMVNNFNIRHNNLDPSIKNYNERFAKMSNKEKEEWYDTVYEQALYLFMSLDQKERTNKIKLFKQDN